MDEACNYKIHNKGKPMPKLTNENLKEFLEEIWELCINIDLALEEDELLKSAKKVLKKWGIKVGE